MLTVNILGLNEQPISISGELSARELDLTDDDLALAGPVCVNIEVQRVGEKVHIRGTLGAQVKLVCSRCLADYQYDLKSELDLVALPAGSEARPSQRAPENEEEEDTSVMAYEHDQVQLAPEVRSALILGVPMKPLCSEDCPGLCLECGERLDAGHRPHAEASPGGPFAALKKLLDEETK